MPDEFRLDNGLAERLRAIGEDPESFENRERGWRHGHEYVSKHIDDKLLLAARVAEGLPRLREFAARQRGEHPAKRDAALTNKERGVKRIVRELLGLPNAPLDDLGPEATQIAQERFERNSSRFAPVNLLVVPFAAIQAAEAYRDTLGPNGVVLTESEHKQWLKADHAGTGDDDWFLVHAYEVDTNGT